MPVVGRLLIRGALKQGGRAQQAEQCQQSKLAVLSRLKGQHTIMLVVLSGVGLRHCYVIG